MKYYYYSPDEKAHQRAMGLWPAFILADGVKHEFTSTTNNPVYSAEHRLVYKTELY